MKRVLTYTYSGHTSYYCDRCGWSGEYDNPDMEECPNCGNRDLERITEKDTTVVEELPVGSTTRSKIGTKYQNLDCYAYVLQYETRDGIKYSSKNGYVDFDSPSMQIFDSEVTAKQSAKFRRTYGLVPRKIKIFNDNISLVGGRR